MSYFPGGTPGGGGGGTKLVFRPGAASSSGIVYNDFNDLYQVLDSMGDVDRCVILDGSLTSPVVIPPKSGGGDYAMKHVWLRGLMGYGLATEVRIADGTTFTDLLNFARVNIRNLSSTSPMVLSDGDLVTIQDFADLSNDPSAGAPLFDASSLTGWAVLDHAFWGTTGALVPDEVVFGGIPSGVSFYIQLGERSRLGNNCISADAGSMIELILNGSSAFYLKQDKILGTFSLISRAFSRFNSNPGRGVAAATSNISTVNIGDWLRLDAGLGTWQQTMPVVLGASTELTDAQIVVATETSGTNNMTLAGDGAETIDGLGTYTLPAGTTKMFISDGVSNWISIG